MSTSVVAQELTLMRIAARPRQVVPPHQHVPLSWTKSMTRLVLSSSPKATTTWLNTTSFNTSTPAFCSDRCNENVVPSLRQSLALRPMPMIF
jgi:hypothetical protein